MVALHRPVFSVLLLSGSSAAWADVPRVHFDMPYAIACRDVTPPDLAAADPSQRLVEARFEISSLLLSGREQDLTQYFIRIDSPRRTLSVIDYLPQTLHESPLASPIVMQRSREFGGKIGINLSGKYEVLPNLGPGAEIGEKHGSSVKYELLPPLETVAASGTLLRGAGVFFKLKSSPRHLLEGSGEFALVLRVRREWRADYVRVRCEAEGIQRGLFSSLDETIRCGEREFLVALYQEGDDAARQSAEDFARKEASLRTAARAKPPAKSAGKSGPSRQDGASWLPNLLYGPTSGTKLPPHSSPQLQHAAADFAAARERIGGLSAVAE
ncbi:MAG: hypothetical protein SFU86_22260 [Pirellulaceae bacterium]|nr:hypothetical protein [Pirellulaceae bacterium]